MPISDWQGSFVALITPMTDREDIDYAALDRLIDWHLSMGTDGLVVLGTTGEAPTLQEPEKIALVRQTLKQVDGRIPVLVGTGSYSTADTVALSQTMQSLGADGLLVVTPYYNKPTQEGLYQHYSRLAKAVSIPIMLYNVPGRTGCDLKPETVARLSAFSNIVAVKETVSVERVHELVRLAPTVSVFCGEDAINDQMIAAGAKGLISVTANVMPSALHQMCVAMLEGHCKKAQQIHEALMTLHKHLFLQSNPIPVKWLMQTLGLIQGGLRLPLTPFAEEFHVLLLEAYRSAERALKNND